jgi:hypothetical protein
MVGLAFAPRNFGGMGGKTPELPRRPGPSDRDRGHTERTPNGHRTECERTRPAEDQLSCDSRVSWAPLNSVFSWCSVGSSFPTIGSLALPATFNHRDSVLFSRGSLPSRLCFFAFNPMSGAAEPLWGAVGRIVRFPMPPWTLPRHAAQSLSFSHRVRRHHMSPNSARNLETATQPCSWTRFHPDHGPPCVRPSADPATSLRPPNAVFEDSRQKIRQRRLTRSAGGTDCTAQEGFGSRSTARRGGGGRVPTRI